MKSIAPWMLPQDLVAPDPARGFLQKLRVRQGIHSALLMAALLWISSTLDPSSARAAVSVAVDPAAQVPAAPACPEVPILSVSLVCSTNPVAPGGIRTFSGTLVNAANVEVRNISIKRVMPDGSTPLKLVGSLPPGASVSFSGDYRVPAVDSCQAQVRVLAAGVDTCGGQPVISIQPIDCAVVTSPALTVRLACPLQPPVPGGEMVCSGVVRNSGDITLRQVVVNDPRILDAAGVLLTRDRLDPGESAIFALRIPTAADACDVPVAVDASGVDACSGARVFDSNSLRCRLAVVGGLEISQICAQDAASLDGTSGYDLVVRNSGKVALTRVAVLESQVGGWSGRGTELWFDDQLPAGVLAEAAGGDSWETASVSSPRLSGYSAWQSSVAEGFHQLYFIGDSRGFPVAEGEVLVAHVFLDPVHPPREVMLQWYDGSWEHRAYWGENLLAFGIDGTAALRPMGTLPKAGEWVRLEVPASLLGLQGRTLRGVALTLHGGRATWDALGKRPGGDEPPIFSVDRLEPGQSVPFRRTGLRPPVGACSVTTLLSAQATVTCSGETIHAFTTGTCNLPTRASLEVMQAEPVAPESPGLPLVFRGTVRNAGPVAVTQVVVLHNRTGAGPLLEIPRLLPGESRTFSGNFPTPVNACRVFGTVSAAAIDACSGQRVFDSSTVIHALPGHPQLSVAKVCPTAPVVAGQRVEYEGVVMNTGDITLMDVHVRSSRSGDVPLLGPLVLAPGEAVSFLDSYVPQAGDCGMDSVSATGMSLCQEPVSGGMTLRCPHLPVQPAIHLTRACPSEAPFYGKPYRALGTVKNTGNVALVDVRIVHDGTSEQVPVLGPITLLPGESTEYVVDGIAPLESCEWVDSVSVSAIDRCDGTGVFDRVTAVCPLQSFPRLGLSKACPTPSPQPGQPWMYGGTVTNTGNVPLVGVQVFSIRSGQSPVRVFGPILLAPGEWAHFVAEAMPDTGGVPGLDLLEAVGEDACRGTHVSVRADCQGPLPQASPVLRSLVHGEGVATLSWSSKPGVSYLVEYSESFPVESWTPLQDR
ncbi:MAG: hypothetical protein ACKOKG_09205, partial [Verrucomicrobiota bacterium]